MAAVAVMAALCAWLGASLIVLGDGSRGVGVGVGFATAGLAAIAWQSTGPVAALAILAGGAVVALRQTSSGDGEWGIMPVGSTPRLILCIALGLLTLWFAAAVSLGPGVAHRFVVVVILGLTAARILTGQEPSVVMAAAAVLSLAVGAGADLGGHSIWPYVAAGAVACLVALIPVPRPHAT